MIIALASPPVAASVERGLEHVRRHIEEAASRGARIVCFPEAYIPGLKGMDFPVPSFDREQQDDVVQRVSAWSREHGITTILGMERIAPAGRQIAALVVGSDGVVMGWQTKNQLDPSEEPNYVPGEKRQLFETDGVRFAIAICHEGFRYPETVRWGARRGAQIVFHPHATGSDSVGTKLHTWGAPEAPYYERAVMCRALENTIFIASVNYAFACQESATSVISPSGECIAHLPYGHDGVLVVDVDMNEATGLLASRLAPERYGGGMQDVL